MSPNRHHDKDCSCGLLPTTMLLLPAPSDYSTAVTPMGVKEAPPIAWGDGRFAAARVAIAGGCFVAADRESSRLAASLVKRQAGAGPRLLEPQSRHGAHLAASPPPAISRGGSSDHQPNSATYASQICSA